MAGVNLRERVWKQFWSLEPNGSRMAAQVGFNVFQDVKPDAVYKFSLRTGKVQKSLYFFE